MIRTNCMICKRNLTYSHSENITNKAKFHLNKTLNNYHSSTPDNLGSKVKYKSSYEASRIFGLLFNYFIIAENASYMAQNRMKCV